MVFALTIVGLVLRPLIPRPPLWARNFINEEVDEHGAHVSSIKPQRSSVTVILAMLSALGCALEAIPLSSRPRDISRIFVASSWVCALSLAV